MSAKELLKKAEFMRDVEVASMVADAVVKFKESKEFTTLLKKDYHNGYNVEVMETFIISERSTRTSTIRSWVVSSPTS